MTPILLIFLRINEHTGQLLVGPKNCQMHCGSLNHTFGWAKHASPGPRCSASPTMRQTEGVGSAQSHPKKLS